MKTNARIPRRPRGERELRARNEGSFPSAKVCSPLTQEGQETEYYFAQTQTLRQGLEGDFRFPRPCRFVARRFVFACEFCVSQPLSGNLSHSHSETLPIVQILAI